MSQNVTYTFNLRPVLGAMADLERMAQDGGNPFLRSLNPLTDP